MSSLLKEAYEFIKELAVGNVDDKNATILDDKEKLNKVSQIKEETEAMDTTKGMPSSENQKLEEPYSEKSGDGFEEEISSEDKKELRTTSSESDSEEDSEEGDVVDRLEETLRKFIESELASGTTREELADAVDELANKLVPEDFEDFSEGLEVTQGLDSETMSAQAPPWLGGPASRDAEQEDSEEEDDKKKKSDEEEEIEDEAPEDVDEEESSSKKSAILLRETDKYAAVLYNTEDSQPEGLEWVVFDKKSSSPVMRVLAGRAFGDKLYDKPYPDDYPNHKFSSYGQAFISEYYGDALLSAIETEGLGKACEASNGLLVKKSQIGVSPTTGGPTAMQERQPVGSTTPTAPLDSQSSPAEGGADVNLNPKQMGADENLSPVTVIDFLLGVLPYLVVSGVTTPGEIVQDLKDTFNDDDSSARFIGALTEKSRNLKEHLGVQGGKESFDLGTLLGGSQPPQTGVQTDMPGAKMSELQAEIQDLRNKVGEYEKKIAEYEKSEVLRAKIASAVSFIRNEMQTRGANGKPLSPSVDYLMMTGMPKDAAIKEERKITYKKAEELIGLDDAAWNALQDTVMQVPYLHESSTDQMGEFSGEVRKTSSVLPIFMANDNSLNFDGFDESMFESPLTQLAREHNAKRARKRARF